MVFRPIRRFGDPVLRAAADPVAVFDDKLEALVTDLLDTVDAPGHAGVAAPQIGVGLRAFSYNVDGHIGYVINPELVETSEQQQTESEGCLSLPGLSFETTRAESATVRGVDLRNEPVTVTGSGLMARCLQHEVDHLDGKLYIQRLDPESRREAMRQIRDQDWFWQR